jgi:formamidopyrimidine-DNA glycosylase
VITRLGGGWNGLHPNAVVAIPLRNERRCAPAVPGMPSAVPELPDVEHFRRLVVQHGVGMVIDDVEVRSPTIVRHISVEALRAELGGTRITTAERHGKWLIVATDGPELLLHFGMTGSLRWTTGVERRVADRVAIVVGDGSLVVEDRRNLATITVVPAGGDRVAITGDLGPDACSITAGQLNDRLVGSHRVVKAVLMDQAVVAGLGNTSTDEVLWRSRLDPSVRAGELDLEERRELRRALRRFLSLSVAAGRIPRTRSWLTGQRGEREPTCPRCHGPLAWRRVAGRSSLWCPHCQGARQHRRAGRA